MPLNLNRIDLIKIDVEGMEIDVLNGAKKSILKFKPILLIEFIKSDLNLLSEFLNSIQYNSIPMNGNIIALHRSDPMNHHIRIEDNILTIENI